MDLEKALDVYNQMEKSIRDIKDLEDLLLKNEKDEITTLLFTLCYEAEKAILKAQEKLYYKVIINN